MFSIEYKFDYQPSLTFNYKGDTIEFEKTIITDSILDYDYTDWAKLIERDGMCLEFGDEYGSHVDHGIVSIFNEEGKMKFQVDGAKGGDIVVSCPLSLCKDEFSKLVDLLKTEVPIGRQLLKERDD